MKRLPVKWAVATAAGVALAGFVVSAGPVSAVEAPRSGYARIALPTTTTTATTTTSPTKPTSTTGTTKATSTGPTKTVTSTPKTTGKTPARPIPKGGVETGGGGMAADGPDA